MKIFLRENSIKFIIIIISLFIFLLFGFAIYIDSCLKRAYSIGEFTLKIGDINQENHLVTPEVIDRGLKKALLSCQLEPKHWGVKRVDVYGSGSTYWNDWNNIVQLTNNARVVLLLTNTLLKTGSQPPVDNKRDELYCSIIFSEEEQALNYDLRWPH